MDWIAEPVGQIKPNRFFIRSFFRGFNVPMMDAERLEEIAYVLIQMACDSFQRFVIDGAVKNGDRTR